MERNEEALSPLDGISVSINKRHAFVHERVLEYIVRETNQAGGVIFNKKEMANWLGCCPRSLDRAVHRLREQGARGVAAAVHAEWRPRWQQVSREGSW